MTSYTLLSNLRVRRKTTSLLVAATCVACTPLGACALLAGVGSDPGLTTIDEAGVDAAMDVGNPIQPAAEGSVEWSDSGDTGVPSVDGGTDGPEILVPPTQDPPDASCDPTAPFGAPIPIEELNVGGGNNFDARLTINELTVYFASNRQDPSNGIDLRIYVANRSRFADPFDAPVLLGGVNPTENASQFAPSVTRDGLSFYLNEYASVSNSFSVWLSTRTSLTSSFGVPVLLPSVNMAGLDSSNPFIAPDGSTLYFYVSNIVGPAPPPAIYSSQVLGDGGFGTPAAIAPLDTGNATNLAVSADQRTIVFASTRGDDAGVDADIWISQRASTVGNWVAPVPLTNVNSKGTDDPTWISGDGCRLYLQSTRSGVMSLYLAERL